MSTKPIAAPDFQTIAALRKLLGLIDRVEEQLGDTPIDHDTYRVAQRQIESLRAIITRRLSPLERRLLDDTT